MANEIAGKVAGTAAANVLVVEDDEDIAFLLEFILSREGLAVELHRDGRDASRRIETGAPPRLALLDIMLPFVDGFQLIRKIREQPGWEEVPVLMLTAKSGEADVVRALELGANDYLVKPFQPNELVARLKRHLK